MRSGPSHSLINKLLAHSSNLLAYPVIRFLQWLCKHTLTAVLLAKSGPQTSGNESLALNLDGGRADKPDLLN